MNDSSPVKIYYDGVAVFDQVHCPEPLVTRSDNVSYGSRKIGQTTSLTLEGEITGAGFSQLIEAQERLLSGFSSDFKSFEIKEDSETIYENLVKVNSIDFGSSKYVGLVPFTISLTAYEDKFFPSQYSGVLDPVNSVEYSQGEDGSVTISRSVSARGINTKSADGKSNALNNAISYVQSLTGYANVTLPYFINDSGDLNNLILTSQSEDINRFAATYSVNETYVYSTYPSGSSSDFYGGSLTYPLYKKSSVNFQTLSKDSPFNSLSISNEWSTNKTDLSNSYSSSSMDYLRDRVSKYIQSLKDGSPLYSDDGIISELRTHFPSLENYKTFFYSLSEDALAHKINFTLEFSDDPTFDPEYGVYFNESFSAQKDSLRDIDQVSYSFNISPFGLQTVDITNNYTYYQNHSYNQKKSYNYLKGKLLTGVNDTIEKYCLSRTKDYYSVLLTGQYDFEDQFKILSINQSNNPNNGGISIESQSDNSPKHPDNIYQSVGFNLNISPEINTVTLNKSLTLNGHYLMTEHDTYNRRENVSLSIDGYTNPSGMLDENRSEALSGLTSMASIIFNQISGSNVRIRSQSKSFSKESLQAAMQLDISQQRNADSYYFNVSPILRDGNQAS